MCAHLYLISLVEIFTIEKACEIENTSTKTNLLTGNWVYSPCIIEVACVNKSFSPVFQPFFHDLLPRSDSNAINLLL